MAIPIPKPRGGQATSTARAPRTPGKSWQKPANWKQMTAQRWAANHPQPLFPSTNIGKKDLSGLLTDARTQVARTYAATPMPTMVNYLQPFADASARNQQTGQNYVNYLQGAAATAQNISGAFGQAVTGGINAGQVQVGGQGGSAPGSGAIPAAGASLIPMAGVGSSFTNYLNAEQPYVGAAVNETQRLLNSEQAKAAGDYQNMQAQRRSDVQDAIQKLYQSSVQTLQSNKDNAYKNAVTSYLALGKTGAAAEAAAEKRRYDTGRLKQGQAKVDIAKQKLANDQGYRQQNLDIQRRKALKTTGIDTAAALRTLNAPAAGKSPGAGPQGQSGGNYTIHEERTDANGNPLTPSTVQKFVPYGQKIPKSVSFTNPDGSTVRRTVTFKGRQYPPKASAGRRATGASWDSAVKQLRARYPGRITSSWLKTNFPPRPSGS